MRICPECGARYEDDAAFCPMDGSPLGELMSPSVSAPVPVATPSRASTSDSALRWQSSAATSTSGPRAQAAPSGAASVAVEGWDEPAPGPDPEEPLIGVILGERYRVDERIGAGGMGIVYRATHVLIGRMLAIKILRHRYALEPDVAQRFAQEARIASSVKHPNVVDIIDYGTSPQGSPYCVMEFLPGHSLAREIVEHGPLEPRRALGIAVHIARGLAAAHQAGVIHRDLKPDNVFLVPSDAQAAEQVKILDFGIARIAGRKTRLTAAGTIVGTPEYMSPEQARGDELDGRSDIYALGVLLFETLTGRVPLRGDSMVGTLQKQVFELPPPIRTIDPRFAAYPSIEAALVRLLAKNRDERPPTALDAARLIETAATNDLLPVDDGHRAQAALAGWSQPPARPSPDPIAPDRPRRSTIMIGSGAITSAHQNVEADGPATGSFAAKQGAEAQVKKRPSVIVTDAPAGGGRPARIHRVSAPPPAPVYRSSPNSPSSTPTPPRASALGSVKETPMPVRADGALGKRPSGGLRRRHLPLILIGVGAAIFAALVTIGFVRWLQRRDARNANVTSMKGSVLDGRYATRALAGPDPSSPLGWSNTDTEAPVEGAAREFEPPFFRIHDGTVALAKMRYARPASQPTSDSWLNLN